MVFNIQRYSIQDGPGIRTTVFLKGCPLKCQWCSNPESQVTGPELMFHRTLCNNCGKCVNLCPRGALSLREDTLQIERGLCDNCGACVNACTRQAFSLVGKLMTVEEVLDEVRRDSAFYRSSGGGVTVSGGEPLLQADFVAQLLEECHESGLHTCLDTTGYGSPAGIRKVLPHVDMVLYDLKHVDRASHGRLTGVSNEQILENVRLFDQNGKEIVIRIPLIPGKNTSEENLVASAGFAATLKRVSRIDILPYHRYGEGKYAALGREYPLKGLKTLTEEEIKQCRTVIESHGITCRVEG